MQFHPTSLAEVMRIRFEPFTDSRGSVMETYHADAFAKAGIEAVIRQVNHTSSVRGTLRGLHYQIRRAQGKLVRVVGGEIFDVAVDLRRSSPMFGRWEGVALTGEAREALWIPPGFAHGFYVLSERAEVIYYMTEYYNTGLERTLLWNDPDVGVDWPILPGTKPLLSKKDARGVTLHQAEVYA